MTVTCTETAECDKWAEIVALAQQGNKKMLGVILQAFDIKLRKIAHTSAYKGFAEDGEQIERKVGTAAGFREAAGFYRQ